MRAKDSVLRTLSRLGIAHETIEALRRELPDPVDIDRDGNLLLAHGITLDRLIDRRGGSP
jgi:hypothetical protein